ncbi:MAG: M13 family metallopeptidase [Alphaproteobacteria bacterium]|nr:M13 family metallopeptidase [Alphaproteobacteria bacterium]
MLPRLALALLLIFAALPVTAQQRSGIDLSAIDTSVRPQDDFWKFANGKWLAATEIPPDRAGWDTFSILREATQAQLRALIEGIDPQASTEARKIADLYAAFMDREAVQKAGMAPIRPEIDRIHGLADVSALPALLAHLYTLWVRTPFDLSVWPDEHDPSTFVAHFGQGHLGLPDRDYYLRDDEHFKKIRAAYRTHIVKLLTLAGEPASEADADAILALETSLARLYWTRVQNRDPIATYNKKEIAALPALVTENATNGGGWRDYFANAMVAPEVKSLIVLQPSYIESVGAVLKETPLAVWRTYLVFNLISTYANYLPEAIEKEGFEFDQHTLRGVPQQPERWKRGVALVDRSLAFALGKLYVARHFPSENKAHAEAMIGHLMAVYRQTLETLDWMGPETRKKALEKLAAIRPRIGYPDKWRDYSGLEIRRDDLLGSVMRARRFDYAYWLGKIGTKVDRDEWYTAPQIVNAFYSALRNEIVFPAGILQPPFFDAGADDAANFGAIGTVVGHEISHAFDDQGSRFDASGVLVNWWTPEDRERFDAKTRILVKQYDAFSPLPGYTVNGALTLGENVADNAGLAMALKAYRHSLGGKTPPVLDGYGGEQRLFLAFAQIWHEKAREALRIERLKVDPHSPGQFRADGSLRNQPAFYEAFDVKPGDGMYLAPGDRTTIW